MQALDFNPFKTSLLASGASDSEIYIWDLTNPTNPLTPGSKTLPPDNISCVAWNRQVQHILASASPCGRCVVWDLRKNEPIIKVSDQSATVSSKNHMELIYRIHLNPMTLSFKLLYLSDFDFFKELTTCLCCRFDAKQLNGIQMWQLR